MYERGFQKDNYNDYMDAMKINLFFFKRFWKRKILI